MAGSKGRMKFWPRITPRKSKQFHFQDRGLRYENQVTSKYFDNNYLKNLTKKSFYSLLFKGISDWTIGH